MTHVKKEGGNGTHIHISMPLRPFEEIGIGLVRVPIACGGRFDGERESLCQSVKSEPEPNRIKPLEL